MRDDGAGAAPRGSWPATYDTLARAQLGPPCRQVAKLAVQKLRRVTIKQHILRHGAVRWSWQRARGCGGSCRYLRKSAAYRAMFEETGPTINAEDNDRERRLRQ